MPEIKKIVVTKGGKINLGDYQNAERSVTVEAEVLPGEDEFEAFDAVSQKAREWLAAEIRELVENGLNAADLLGVDEDTIRRRVRYAPGYTYLKSVDTEAADMLMADMVSELAAVSVDDDAPELDDGEPDAAPESTTTRPAAEPETCSSCGAPKDGAWCVNEQCEAFIPF